MVASATIEDFVSFRSTIEGSFFILHLCKALQKYGHEKALGDIMINVNKNVASYRQDFPSQPEYTTTMTKKFMFKRSKASIVNGMEKMIQNQLFTKQLNNFLIERASGCQA